MALIVILRTYSHLAPNGYLARFEVVGPRLARLAGAGCASQSQDALHGRRMALTVTLRLMVTLHVWGHFARLAVAGALRSRRTRFAVAGWPLWSSCAPYGHLAPWSPCTSVVILRVSRAAGAVLSGACLWWLARCWALGAMCHTRDVWGRPSGGGLGDEGGSFVDAVVALGNALRRVGGLRSGRLLDCHGVGGCGSNTTDLERPPMPGRCSFAALVSWGGGCRGRSGCAGRSPGGRVWAGCVGRVRWLRRRSRGPRR